MFIKLKVSLQNLLVKGVDVEGIVVVLMFVKVLAIVVVLDTVSVVAALLPPPSISVELI